ncbi:ectoine hydrolase [Thiomicrorhabdus sediminis]|uniref:Aminopeptidase P family protein n=1 Tax=Thiomicrorhabdus sediminis TaxID=2580412 RepID=A0A4P9K514_9GAMM|nr:ectoine hydrolase [Thiomicrorhabdus sediminis]QCU89948.1 aminopeptidase P family protein [Thiomicrorhabdus sediminis]
MRERDDMTFPFSEYQRRVNELRGRMAERLLDAVIISDAENILYLTDYQTTGYSFFQALVVPLEGEPFMVTRKLEESNVIHRTWVEITRPFPDTGDAIQVLISSLVEFGLAGKTIGYERNSYYFNAYHQDVFRTSFVRSRLMDCFGIVEQSRICKSEYELEVMRKAALATKAGMKAGLDAVQAGVTENEIGGAISQAMFAAGGEIPAVMPYVTSGPRTMIGHASWEGRTVQPGEHVFIEIAGSYRKYHTAMMRTAICGELSDSMYEAQEVMKKALSWLRSELRPGMTVSDVDRMVRSILHENKVGARLITRSGYSIGIAFPPSWDEGYILSLNQGQSDVLKPGMTFHVIPWLWGVDGDKTCGISDTFYITEDGCGSFFDDFDQDFVIKPSGASASSGKKSLEIAGKIEPKTKLVNKDSADKKHKKVK